MTGVARLTRLSSLLERCLRPFGDRGMSGWERAVDDVHDDTLERAWSRHWMEMGERALGRHKQACCVRSHLFDGLSHLNLLRRPCPVGSCDRNLQGVLSFGGDGAFSRYGTLLGRTDLRLGHRTRRDKAHSDVYGKDDGCAIGLRMGYVIEGLHNACEPR